MEIEMMDKILSKENILKEKFLIFNNWIPIDYPYPRTSDGYEYTVYSHKFFEGVWGLDEAIKKVIEWDSGVDKITMENIK
jgi:hypothetical protein